MFSDISTAIVVTVSVLPVLAFLAVALRLSIRRTKPQSLAVDDYLIIVALVYFQSVFVSTGLISSR